VYGPDGGGKLRSVKISSDYSLAREWKTLCGGGSVVNVVSE
jgi:hypothetical protein